MSTLSNEAGAAAVAVMTDVSITASARSKEDARRRKLQEWQESKASGKRTPAPERKTVPDRKAQFFERRERRLEEEKKKRMSRPGGRENSISTPTPTVSCRKSALYTTYSSV